MRRLAVVSITLSFIVSMLSISALGAIKTTDRSNFTVQTHERLLELSKEIENLKHREDMVPDERKNSFEKELGAVDTDWNAAHDYALKLNEQPTKAQQKQMAQLISRVEHHIDNAENAYGEKSFGLGGMLGF